MPLADQEYRTDDRTIVSVGMMPAEVEAYLNAKPHTVIVVTDRDARVMMIDPEWHHSQVVPMKIWGPAPPELD